jgi:xanthine dehydrogenase accessory factor
MLPAPRLCILGDTPVAHALARLARDVGHDVVDVPNDAEAVVVATMGVGDEEALEAAARSSAPYIGLVASRKKAAFLFDYARASGVPDEQIARVKAPAGLDLGGMSAPEIALSIMAEILQQRHGRQHEERGPTAGAASQNVQQSKSVAVLEASEAGETATDPVCGMSVEIATAKHTIQAGGQTYYFCCPHCKARFAKAHA